jgi:hypothetical protein
LDKPGLTRIDSNLDGDPAISENYPTSKRLCSLVLREACRDLLGENRHRNSTVEQAVKFIGILSAEVRARLTLQVVCNNWITA